MSVCSICAWPSAVAERTHICLIGWPGPQKNMSMCCSDWLFKGPNLLVGRSRGFALVLELHTTRHACEHLMQHRGPRVVRPNDLTGKPYICHVVYAVAMLKPFYHTDLPAYCLHMRSTLCAAITHPFSSYGSNVDSSIWKNTADDFRCQPCVVPLLQSRERAVQAD